MVPVDMILKKVWDINNYAYEELLLSIATLTDEGQVAFHIVTGSKSMELPDGDAPLVSKRLKEKYAPILALRKLELCRAFQMSKLKDSNQDPETWITYLEGLRMKLKDLNSTTTDEDLIVHILNNLTEDYEVQLLKLEKKLGSTTTVLTIGTLIAIHSHDDEKERETDRGC